LGHSPSHHRWKELDSSRPSCSIGSQARIGQGHCESSKVSADSNKQDD
jgi:hypothetical protein